MNTSKIKHYLLLLLTCLCMFCFFGCGKQDYTLQINDDDTCNFSVKITVNSDAYNQLSSEFDVDTDKLNREKNTMTGSDIDNVDAIFQETAAIFNQYGYQIQSVNDSIDIGFEASKTYNTIYDFNNEIQELYNLNLVGCKVEVTKEASRYQKNYKCYGTLEYVFDKDIDMEDEFTAKMFNTQADLDSMVCRLVVVMPYSTAVMKSDGTGSPEGITWQTSYKGDQIPVHVISSARNLQAYIITAIIVLVVLIGVVILISRLLRQYRNKKRYEKEHDYLSQQFADDDDDDDDEN